MLAVASQFRAGGGDVRDPRAASRDELARVHTTDYIGLIAETAGRATALDADTFTSPDTYDVACLAAGAAISAVDCVLEGVPGLDDGSPAPLRGSRPTDAPDLLRQARPTGNAGARRALALIRPPGHHAETDRAMGFCFFNNVAVAAAHARARGLERVAIVDFDVHHGNGTQWSFYTDPSVLFISSHQFPYYPGTGAATEIGSGRGTGYTINLPLAAGATDEDYELVYARVAVPVLHQFKPDLILLSAGFDAYIDDPLGGMRLSSACFGRLTAMVAAVADQECGGRVAGVVEGGYSLQGLADGLRATIAALDEDTATAAVSEVAAAADANTARGAAALAAVLPVLRPHWQL